MTCLLFDEIRSRQDIGENSKLPVTTAVQHEIRIGIVYPDQGENWRRLGRRPYEKADICIYNFHCPVHHPSRDIANRQFPYRPT